MIYPKQRWLVCSIFKKNKSEISQINIKVTHWETKYMSVTWKVKCVLQDRHHFFTFIMASSGTRRETCQRQADVCVTSMSQIRTSVHSHWFLSFLIHWFRILDVKRLQTKAPLLYLRWSPEWPELWSRLKPHNKYIIMGSFWLTGHQISIPFDPKLREYWLEKLAPIFSSEFTGSSLTAFITRPLEQISSLWPVRLLPPQIHTQFMDRETGSAFIHWCHLLQSVHPFFFFLPL